MTKRDPTKLVIDVEKIDKHGNAATFIHTSPPGLTTTDGPGDTCESRWVLHVLRRPDEIRIVRKACGFGGVLVSPLTELTSYILEQFHAGECITGCST